MVKQNSTILWCSLLKKEPSQVSATPETSHCLGKGGTHNNTKLLCSQRYCWDTFPSRTWFFFKLCHSCDWLIPLFIKLSAGHHNENRGMQFFLSLLHPGVEELYQCVSVWQWDYAFRFFGLHLLLPFAEKFISSRQTPRLKIGSAVLLVELLKVCVCGNRIFLSWMLILKPTWLLKKHRIKGCAFQTKLAFCSRMNVFSSCYLPKRSPIFQHLSLENSCPYTEEVLKVTF